MEPFTIFESTALPLDIDNVDTDQIIPARFLSRKRTEGLANFCFHDIRYNEDGSLKEDTALNNPEYAQAKILIAGAIFGSGSSRESAVWALNDPHESVRPSGFKCIVAASFGDIFFNNATKNGVLPVILPLEKLEQLKGIVKSDSTTLVKVSLEEQSLSVGSLRFRFEIDPFRKNCLVRGLDDVALTKENASECEAFEKQYRLTYSWM